MLLDGERRLPHGASHSPAVPPEKPVEVAAEGGSSMELLMKGAKALTVDIVLILLERSSVCSLGVYLHVGLLETRRTYIRGNQFANVLDESLHLASHCTSRLCINIVPGGQVQNLKLL